MKKNYIILITVGIIAVQAIVLYFLGHVWICKCGYIKLWHGVTFSSENSQHISDWYSFSHIIHGFAFYWFAWLLGKKRAWSVGTMFLLALFVESAWEIWENTDFIINRYREVTISLDYYGDSISNSVMDALFMVAGFWWAYRMPVWTSIALTVAMEVWVGWFIHDNLALNIIMLIHPFESILKWQSGG
ncbi:MAG: hypothetical protein A3B86_01450 [Candidatus Yanofskybacteria bacterium RIFCSPHIGHO2_02_FULL_38_22b]|uniref:Uncharacterized protein n=1 Tax=Candidatus Yanofskybacteria bacterium RIFCSPHIGHO2_02_FULL_38_22b TaxID=1802673 RepID=A0A1F8F577_9BACT|nr:MAG: hypothetical protein A3B86_01450 [Candidatus Yanofskybacteria bacterium RIFCSPHIGHO2_02_FULL_38_22b]OGN20478.1 MAG: hypothetical protein A2910_02310 [Candidatus Yanofskybacteria bacterium RIFCSPLOWO2_01_FULL_39_28]